MLVAFALGLGLGRRRRTAVANQGADAIRCAFTTHFTGPSYHLLHNLTLPFHDGTTQIDHVLVATSSIFVIEAKHYSGTIVANPSSLTWTKIIFNHEYRFQNPLRQNYKHFKAIQQILDFVPVTHIHSLVVFTGMAEFQTERPKDVFDVPGVVRHIRQFTEKVLTENRVQFGVGRRLGQ